MKYLLLGAAFIFLLITSVNGQSKTTGKSPYYHDINQQGNLQVCDQLDASLNIQYEDRYGRAEKLTLTLLNGKYEEVGSFQLSKSFGLNHFKINISNVYSSWKEGDVYTCKLTDEMKHTYSLLLRKKTPETEDPSINILVNPISLDCGDITGNLVDFYASISGGKTPYTVNWYVMNEARADFLYQPREELIERPGNTMVVRVDKNPNYYVMVLVKDACGKEQRQMVYMVCEEKKKKINTIFVEPLKHLPSTTKIIN